MEQDPRHSWILNDLPTAEKGTDCMRQYYLGLAAAFLRARHDIESERFQTSAASKAFPRFCKMRMPAIEAKGLSDVKTASGPVIRGRSANWHLPERRLDTKGANSGDKDYATKERPHLPPAIC
jgi:hypothetical protein